MGLTDLGVTLQYIKIREARINKRDEHVRLSVRAVSCLWLLTNWM